MKLIIPGRCVPSVRMTQRSKHVNPRAQAYLAYKDEVAYRAKRICAEPISGHVEMSADIYLKSLSGRRGDGSNYLKGLEDALNNVAYIDDKQIIHGSFRLIQGEPERVEIEIRRMDD